MVCQHLAVVHRVQLVARQDDELIVRVAPKVRDGATHGVRRPLIPHLRRRRLLGGEDRHEPAAEPIEDVGAGDMVVEARRVELRHDEDPIETGIDAVRDGHIDETVFARERNGRLRPVAREREQPRPGAAAEDDCEDTIHRWSSDRVRASRQTVGQMH